jgi:hypothetical protein
MALLLAQVLASLHDRLLALSIFGRMFGILHVYERAPETEAVLNWYSLK